MKKLLTHLILLQFSILAAAPIDGYDTSLGKYVAEGAVNYEAWQDDRTGLDEYVSSLAAEDLEQLNENERKALWINAYNAFMLAWMLDNYPVKSVNDTKKPFKERRFLLAGEKVSLDDIEHKRLRKMGDPRIHFAIVCASKGCPDLAGTVYRASILDEQLNGAARRYFSQSKGLQFESNWLGKPVVKLSKILKWFGEDFGSSDEQKLKFAAEYAPVEIQEKLAVHINDAKVSYLDYDWSLNGF